MSEVCQELISLDKAIRDILGVTFFPIQIWCDNKSARDCTQKEGCNKLKNFDYPLDEINDRLEFRELTGTKRHMSETHGDYIKTCVESGIVEISWISSKENLADIMTKSLPLDAHKYLRDKILNAQLNIY